MNIKTRFAPSPTGSLHIGNIRTALYSWLFARKKNGKFLLRIEDSDAQRSTNTAVKSIFAGMKWLNLDWDEGPYFQTHRFDRYNSIINYMIDHNLAYKCYCSSDRLQTLRAMQMKSKEKPKYDGYCRFRNLCNNKQNTGSVKSYVVRFCNPQSGKVSFHDQIRGEITYNNKELDDVIIQRVDGSPTYNFCVVVDDMDMNITHIIRGEEHINNTPRQINILKSLQAPIPIYAHVSMVLDSHRKKLSKRNNSLLGIMQYRDAGFLPESILNYLVTLGWSYKDQEFFSLEEMQQYFDLSKVSKSASVFNMEKLLWYNHYYINHLPEDYVASHLLWHMCYQNFDVQNGPNLKDIVRLFAKRVRTLKEMASSCHYFYIDFNIFEKKSAKDYLTPMILPMFQLLKKKLNDIIVWNSKNIKSVILAVMLELSVTIDKVNMPFRVALTGIDFSPDLSETAYVMGKLRTLQRVDQAIFYIHNNNGKCYNNVL